MEYPSIRVWGVTVRDVAVPSVMNSGVKCSTVSSKEQRLSLLRMQLKKIEIAQKQKFLRRSLNLHRQ